jgi:hypothetical protein
MKLPSRTESGSEISALKDERARKIARRRPNSINAEHPCISISPSTLDFEAKPVGKTATMELEITSCGTQPLEISTLRLLIDDKVHLTTVSTEYSTDFTLDLTGLPGMPEGATALTDDDPPIVIPPNESITFQVSFIPQKINPKDPTGAPILDQGYIKIVSNAPEPTLRLKVRGFGVPTDRPTAVIK